MTPKPIRVALSGSGFKFPAHVGALMAVRDAGYLPVEYAGTSGGSIVAGLAACGMPLSWMRDQCMTRDWSDMLTFNPWALMTKMAFCDGSALFDWLREQTGGVTFGELERDLTVTASDLQTMGPFEFSRTATPDVQVALAVRASAAIPFAYAAVQHNGAYLLDGGMVNNIPADRLERGVVPRLGVQLVSKTIPMALGIVTMATMIPRVLALMLSAQESTHVSLSEQLGACVTFVETGYASGLDRNMPLEIRKRLMDDGYAATQQALAKIEAVQ